MNLETYLFSCSQLESLTPQLVNAGSIRMHYPYDKTADEHFNNLKNQYEDSIERMRNLCDQATDPAEFIRLSGLIEFCPHRFKYFLP